MHFIKYVFLILVILVSTLYSLAQHPAEKNAGMRIDSTKINHLSPNKITLADSIINYGKVFMNTPYRYGSGGTSSFDCSGFTSHVYRNFGYDLKRSSADQAKQFDTISRKNLKPGDLVFFAGRRKNSNVGHVGIVTSTKDDGEFDFIHASVQSGVIVSSSQEPYYRSRYIKANRVVDGDREIAVVKDNTKMGNEIPVPMNVPVTQTKKIIPAEFHRVEAGESLTSIARKYNISLHELRELNSLTNSSIQPGKQLKVKKEESVLVSEPIQLASNTTTESSKKAKAVESEPVVEVPVAIHTVRSGESLMSISRLHGISIDDLKRINQLSENRVRIGQVLKLEGEPNSPALATNNPVINQPKQDENIQIASKTKAVVADNQKQGKQEEVTSRLGNEPKSNTEPVVAEKKVETKPALNNEKVTTHKVQPGESLFAISKLYNISVEELKKLNKLESNKLHAGRELKVVSEPLLAENKPETKPQVAAPKIISHKVKSGESLYTISKLYNTTIDEIKRLNNLDDNKLQAGRELSINSDVVLADNKPEAITTKETTHKVKSGESLYTISKLYNTTVDELKKLNNLTDSKLQPGKTLVVNSTQSSLAENKTGIKREAPAKKTITHKVKSGESYYSIASKYGCSIDKLKEWNRKSGNNLQIGERLVIQTL